MLDRFARGRAGDFVRRARQARRRASLTIPSAAADDFVEIDVAIHVITRLQVGLDGAETLGGDGQAGTGFIHDQGVKKPTQVEGAVMASGHEIVAEEIIESIGVELAGEHVREKSPIGFAGQKARDHFGERAVVFGQDSMHVALRVLDDPGGLGFVVDIADALEDMAQGAVTEIVQECGGEAGDCVGVVDFCGSG